MKFIIIALSTFFFMALGHAQKEAIKFNEANLLDHVEVLSSDAFEGRETGTSGNEKARAYIVEQFQKLNVKPFTDSYNQTFEYKRGEVVKTGINLVGYIKGTQYPKKYVVISAHHDHLGKKQGKIFNGADDNASGISALFSFAEVLTKNPPKHSVILVAFDAEEYGINGSSYFVEAMKDKSIMMNLNMDMISRSSKDELYVVGTRYSEPLTSIIGSFENPTNTKLLEGHDGTDNKDDWTYASDHGPFHKAGIPFLYFGNEDHEAYHKPDDDFETITPKFYVNAVKIIITVFKAIDRTDF
ncbi:M28 family peptidase [Winogradskyella flava]|uniref:M28 family peptidase n=1 Tax=Winogradskyella flava TaxID=1884876 RepID=UPI00248F5A85|nr:M28 family peptidase [Winogradskyella flava]